MDKDGKFIVTPLVKVADGLFMGTAYRPPRADRTPVECHSYERRRVL